MQRLAALSILLFASFPAVAHPVHVGEDGGHSHWLGFAAAGAAIAVAGVGVLRGSLARRRREAVSADPK